MTDVGTLLFLALGKNCDILMKNKKGTLRSVRSVLAYIRDEMRVPDEVVRKIVLFFKNCDILMHSKKRKSPRIGAYLLYVTIRGLELAEARR